MIIIYKLNMKKTILILCMAALSMCCTMSAQGLRLTHVKGINSVGLRAGTGWGNTWDVGLSYNYYWGRHWSFVTNVDYESGKFGKSNFSGICVAPGVEASVWHPTTWMYLHLTGAANVGYDWWYNTDMQQATNGFSLGAALGFNLEFYAMRELSFIVAAQQSWRYSWLNETNTNYFSPLFSVGIRYNIHQ